MSDWYGHSMDRQALLSYAADITHLGGVRLHTMADGMGRGARVAQFRTGGGLAFDVLLDRGMDIGQADLNGQPIGWQAAVGYPHPAFYEPSGIGFRRVFHGGLLVGCGLDNVGSPNEDDGETLTQHGRLSTLPASHIEYGGEWISDQIADRYRMHVRGQMRQAALFSHNLLLRREIWCWLGENIIHLRDTIENQGVAPAPYQVLYHCNLGYPLLHPDSELLVESEVTPRDEAAAAGLATYNRFHEPVADYPEQVFYHQPVADEDGYGSATLRNRTLGLGLRLRFRLAELPNLIQWKMMQRGTYVLGLEPANCWVEGRAADRARGILRFLEPGEQVELALDMEIRS